MGLTRESLWRLINNDAPQPVVQPMIEAAYQLELHREWSARGDLERGTSFPIRLFPGNDRLACGRLAVYELLNSPAEEPIKPFLQAWFDLGSNLEHDWVRRLDSYGTLLSANVTADDDRQTIFTDEEHWLNGYVDAIVLKPGTRDSHCVEVKTTSHEKVLKMLSPTPEVPRQHARYLRQTGTYVGLSHELPFSPQVTICKISGLLAHPVSDNPFGECACSCRKRSGDRPLAMLHDGDCDLERVDVRPPDDGTLIYSSREEPLTVASFRVAYDSSFMVAGRTKLMTWKQAFLEDRIPDHPHEGKKAKWGVEPCQWCPMKGKICKPDYQGKIDTLSESNLIAFAQSIDPTWDYDERRNAVLQRWNVREEITDE